MSCVTSGKPWNTHSKLSLRWVWFTIHIFPKIQTAHVYAAKLMYVCGGFAWYFGKSNHLGEQSCCTSPDIWDIAAAPLNSFLMRFMDARRGTIRTCSSLLYRIEEPEPRIIPYLFSNFSLNVFSVSRVKAFKAFISCVLSAKYSEDIKPKRA